MKLLDDTLALQKLAVSQYGVFSTADLKTIFNEEHPAELGRRIQRIIAKGILSRFTRGFYVTSNFSIGVLSQRIAPSSCISFETVLARNLVIGTDPKNRLMSTKVGTSRLYKSQGIEIVHLGLAPNLEFGSEVKDGLRHATVEKALLDTLYFYLRGRKYVFDIYSDMNLQNVDMNKVEAYLQLYKNPKFVSFAKNVLEIA